MPNRKTVNTINPKAKEMVERIIQNPRYRVGDIGTNSCSILNEINQIAYTLRGTWLYWHQYEHRNSVKIGKRLAHKLMSELPRA